MDPVHLRLNDSGLSPGTGKGYLLQFILRADSLIEADRRQFSGGPLNSCDNGAGKPKCTKDYEDFLLFNYSSALKPIWGKAIPGDRSPSMRGPERAD